MSADLTVVLALHDVAPYFPTLLASLQSNAGPGTQFVAVDDASGDDTADLLAAARRELPSLEIVRTDVPVGAATARNLGLERAEGRLVTFFDGDDWMAPGHLATLVSAIDGLGCDFVRTDHVQVHGPDRQLHRAPGRHGVVSRPRDSILPLTRETMVDYPFSWAGIYRRSLGDVLRFVDGLHTATDRPWVWQLHRLGASFATIPHAGVYYRREVEGALTSIGDARRLHLFDAYDAVFAQVHDEPDIRLKAVRQFLGLLARHVSMIDMYGADARGDFERRITTALRAIDPDDYDRAVMPDGRRELLERYRGLEVVS